MEKYYFEVVAVEYKGYFYFLGSKEIEAKNIEEAIEKYNDCRRTTYSFEKVQEECFWVEGIGGKIRANDAICSWINQKNGDEMYICVSHAA